jgi:hypothetical protein
MSFARPFAYNTGSTISGTEQLGDLAIGIDDDLISEYVTLALDNLDNVAVEAVVGIFGGIYVSNIHSALLSTIDQL